MKAPTRRRVPLAAAALAGVVFLAFAPGAFAGGDPSTVASFGSLPDGHLGKMPPMGSAPAHIAPNERVPGFFPSLPPIQQRDQMGTQHWVMLFSDGTDAKSFTAGKGFNFQRRSSVCFTDGERALQMSRRFMFDESDVDAKAPIEWPAWFEARPTLRFNPAASKAANIKMRGRGFGQERPVGAVHAETFTKGADGHATLEAVDAWVDAQTLGARLIAKSSLPLTRIATGPSGIEVYAARDGTTVQAVVTPGKPPVEGPEVEEFAMGMDRLAASLQGSSMANSDCGHLRDPLHPEKGAAEMVVVQATALLPSLEKDEDAKDVKEGEMDRAPFAMDPKAAARFKAMKLMQGLRRRQVNVSISASQMSADKEPIVSVAIGWAGKEGR